MTWSPAPLSRMCVMRDAGQGRKLAPSDYSVFSQLAVSFQHVRTRGVDRARTWPRSISLGRLAEQTAPLADTLRDNERERTDRARHPPSFSDSEGTCGLVPT